MARKSNLVSEAMKSVNDMNLHEKRRLEKEMSSIQLVSDKAKNEWNASVERVERQIQEEASSASDARARMESILHCCSKKAVQSMGHLENAKSSVDQLNKDYAAEIECSIKTRNQENDNFVAEIMSMSTLTDMDLQAATCDVLTIASDALTVDRDAAREIGSISSFCSDHLQTLQGDHTEGVQDIRNLAERCLNKEYLVDHPNTTKLMKKKIDIPSLASIEALRTPSLSELAKEMRSEYVPRGGEVEGKQTFIVQSQTPRSPLTPINL